MAGHSELVKVLPTALVHNSFFTKENKIKKPISIINFNIFSKLHYWALTRPDEAPFFLMVF